ncbi:hypothetical protein TNCV_3644721 [Trichonephila clavipes]|nr:hypothetical protein TNCV_3644721 [Trichonephila clavipes]
MRQASLCTMSHAVTLAYNALLKYRIYFAYPVRFSELIGNIRELIIPKKTPKNISGKVPYRFVTYVMVGGINKERNTHLKTKDLKEIFIVLIYSLSLARVCGNLKIKIKKLNKTGHSHELGGGIVDAVLMPLRTRRIEGLMQIKSVMTQSPHIGVG